MQLVKYQLLKFQIFSIFSYLRLGNLYDSVINYVTRYKSGQATSRRRRFVRDTIILSILLYYLALLIYLLRFSLIVIRLQQAQQTYTISSTLIIFLSILGRKRSTYGIFIEYYSDFASISSLLILRNINSLQNSQSILVLLYLRTACRQIYAGQLLLKNS